MDSQLAERRAVGALIRDRRLRKGLTQEELAEIVGLTQRYISKIEVGGVKMPRDATLEKFCGPLDLTLSDFYAVRGLLPEIPGPQPPVPTLWPDSPHLGVSRMVAYVEDRPGEEFQRRLKANRDRLSRAAYEQWCVDYFRMTEGNATMVFNLYDERG